MLNFCKRNLLHSFLLGFSNYSSEDHQIRYRRFRSMDSGLSLIVGDCSRPDNVLESTAVKPIRRKKISNSGNFNGYCFLDHEISGGNGVNGLRSCTESLGFESSDQMEKEGDDQMVEALISKSIVRSRWIRSVDRDRKRDELMENKKKKKVFPPPLSSMNPNGQPNFFLKPVRKDGRLELTEVRINRPDKILRASRQDGRLRLHFIVPAVKPQEEEEKIQEEEIEEEEEEKQKEKKKEEEEEMSSNVRELKFPLTSSGEGFRRCHELSNHHHHHHHHLHMWNQHHHQVTTRSTVHVL
ncbi:The fantastic four family [Macleaya cordata]|uniref:The fantastic four family n=1 Tax=Macleaya cordata TaxID=56857 RepID=A0A200Q1R7_MACCD|nr:The fantastic four family [Macleaya cordata]